MPTKAVLIQRVREFYNEQTATFLSDSNAFGIPQWLDEGFIRFQEILFADAEAAGKLGRPEHPALFGFFRSISFPWVIGQGDYPLPASYRSNVRLIVSPDGGGHIEASWRPPELDRRIRRYPDNYGPRANEAFYTITADDIGAMVVRLYMPTHNLAPTGVGDITFQFYRNFSPLALMGDGDLCDVPDPYCRSAIFYATGMALIKERTDPGDMVKFAEAEAHRAFGAGA